MAVLDIILPDNRLRCVICHWAPQFAKESQTTRNRVADFLSIYAYRFLNQRPTEKRNIVILGDLNEEPYQPALELLHAHRHRARSRSKTHWADDDVKRAHLYNCSWRLLGEKYPHEPRATVTGNDVAGTYYWAKEHTWHNPDHLIVSAGLLGSDPPYLDESEVTVASIPEFLPEGVPTKFSIVGGEYKGLSDHLPITARIHIGANHD